MQKKEKFSPLVFTAVFLLSCMMLGCLHFPAQAETVLIIENRTGYDIKPLKFVSENNFVKKVVRETKITNSGTCEIVVRRGGTYRVYGQLTKEGRDIYIKSNSFNLLNNAKYKMILEKVIFSREGESVSFISKEEFDNLK